METKLIRILVVLGVPGVALGVFYLLLRQFNFRFDTIGPLWAAIIAVIFIFIVGSITFYAIHRWAPERNVSGIGNTSYARFTVAWPIWAGGYPEQSDVLGLLNKHDDRLRRRLDICLKSALGSGFALKTLTYQGNGYVPLEGLLPRQPQENSIELDISLFGPGHTSAELHEFVSDRLAKEIKNFIEKYVRQSWEGANIFDVNSVVIQD
jgi:hypothetical protein